MGTNPGLLKNIADVNEESRSLKGGLQMAARMVAGYKSEFAKQLTLRMGAKR